MEIQLRHLGSSSVPLGLDALISLGKGKQAAAGGAATPRDKGPAGPGLGADRGGVPPRVGPVLLRSPPPSRTVALFKAVAQEPTPRSPLLPVFLHNGASSGGDEGPSGGKITAGRRLFYRGMKMTKLPRG